MWMETKRFSSYNLEKKKKKDYKETELVNIQKGYVQEMH